MHLSTCDENKKEKKSVKNFILTFELSRTKTNFLFKTASK